MRVLHTADWHLGQTLHGTSRAFEHKRFLDWLLETLPQEAIDALVIAGDVFDIATPSAKAQEQYFWFLAECRRRCPDLDIVVVGGNHDSPTRLDAPGDVLSALGIHMIGGMPKETQRCIFPLRNKAGETAAWILAVPFLRSKDLPEALPLFTGSAEPPDAHKQLIAGHRMLYADLLKQANAMRSPGQAVIATGHCHMKGAKLSEHSERKIQVGGQHTLPLDVFPKQLAYVALGHLHLPQAVLQKEHIRYCGSPIPLSLAERNYNHQVVIFELEGEKLGRLETKSIPKSVAMVRIPEDHRPLQDVLAQLEALPRDRPPDATDEMRPFIEVRVALQQAHPRIRQDVETAMEGVWGRLLKIDVKHPEKLHEETLDVSKKLDSIAPIDVFRACYKRTRDGEAPKDLEHLFEDLLEAVLRAEQ